MFRRSIYVVIPALLTMVILAIGGADTLQEPTEAVRTVQLNASGSTVVVTTDQLRFGRRLFNTTCGECHAGGGTKTNPTVSLGPDDLAGATPSRNHIEGLVDYMKNPTTYDGETEISDIHPSTKSASIYTQMRNLTEDDLTAIAGYILVQSRVSGVKWGSARPVRID